MYKKENLKTESLKMNVAVSKKFKTQESDLKTSPSTMKFFPLSQNSSEDLCYNINQNLFKLEKDVALFHFVLKEIKDIS